MGPQHPKAALTTQVLSLTFSYFAQVTKNLFWAILRNARSAQSGVFFPEKLKACICERNIQEPCNKSYPLNNRSFCLYCHVVILEWHSRARQDERRERIPHTWASSDGNYLKSIFVSVSYCVVILRTTPHWSFRMTNELIKWTWTNNKFQTIIMGHGNSLS